MIVVLNATIPLVFQQSMQLTVDHVGLVDGAQPNNVLLNKKKLEFILWEMNIGEFR